MCKKEWRASMCIRKMKELVDNLSINIKKVNKSECINSDQRKKGTDTIARSRKMGIKAEKKEQNQKLFH